MAFDNSRLNQVAALCLLGGLLAGCSGSTGEAGADNAGQDVPVKAAPVAAPAAGGNMVAAVSLGKPGAPVSMKFELTRKPKVGEPLDILVHLVPEATGITGLQVVFQGSSELQIKSGGELSLAQPAAVGEPLAHTVVVTPVREGIFYLSAVAVAEGAGSQARTFSIPLVVGDAAALEVAKPSLSAPDAKGERVTSMTAHEN